MNELLAKHLNQIMREIDPAFLRTLVVIVNEQKIDSLLQAGWKTLHLFPRAERSGSDSTFPYDSAWGLVGWLRKHGFDQTNLVFAPIEGGLISETNSIPLPSLQNVFLSHGEAGLKQVMLATYNIAIAKAHKDNHESARA